ncbi:restriction endonuclease subunit S [Sulfitobacter sp. 915]|uniref:restriction endonuclease subunit S n=1 Tax=Sulfitobacter sp. 915 TaxID=3368558 RepID=UPI0037466177
MNIAATFGTHAATKNSGTEWLGNIPVEWDVKKMKFLFRDYSRKGMPSAELLSVTQNQGVVPRTWVENRMVMPSGNLESFKFIEKGDFAISLRSFEGGLEYCHHDGIISPAYTVLKRRSEELLPAYYRYLFKSAAFISELQTSIVGIREGKNISFEELSYSLMPIPSPGEQRAIAAFLDRKCAKIDEAVRIKEEQIALLRERRQILVQQAVTRGVNSDAPMKDSGIDWIGEIPAHWEVENPKWLFRHRKQRAIKGEQQLAATQKYGVIPQDEFMEREGRRVVVVFLDFDILKHVEAGDFVMSMRSFQGGLEYSEYTGCVSSAYVALEPGPRIFAKFYKYLFKSNGYIKALQTTSNLVRDGQALRFDNFAMVPLPVVPLHEQRKISEELDATSAKTDKAISIKQDQIAALKEYKTSLINTAVTGKIKVI